MLIHGDGQQNFEALLAQHIQEVEKLITETNQVRRAYTNVVAEIKSLRNEINKFKEYFDTELELIKTQFQKIQASLRDGKNS